MLHKLQIVSFSELLTQNILCLMLNNEQIQLSIHNNIIWHSKCNSGYH